MTVRKKYELPLVARIPNVKFDLGRLLKEVESYDHLWTSLYNANQGLCSAHPELAESNYQHFDQINLTTFKDNNVKTEDLSLLKQECKMLSDEIRKNYGKIGGYREKINKSPNVNPALNEHNWSHPLDFYLGSYIETQIREQFKSTPIRVRMVRLRAGKVLTPHIDYDPSYAVRIVVPIVTSPLVKNVFWKRGERQDFYLPADGSAYFLNVGFKHSVENHSHLDRISLMFSLATQEDLASISTEVRHDLGQGLHI